MKQLIKFLKKQLNEYKANRKKAILQALREEAAREICLRAFSYKEEDGSTRKAYGIFVGGVLVAHYASLNKSVAKDRSIAEELLWLREEYYKMGKPDSSYKLL